MTVTVMPKVQFVVGASAASFGSVVFETRRPIDDAFYWPERSCFIVLTQDEGGKPNAIEVHDAAGALTGILKSPEGLRPYYLTLLASGEPGVVCTVEPSISGWGDWNCGFDLAQLELKRLSPSK